MRIKTENMLEKEIEKIKSWSLDNDIPIFPANIDSDIKKIDWTSTHENTDSSLIGFLDFVKTIKPNFVMLQYNTFDYEVIQDDYIKTCKDLKESDFEDILKKFKELSKTLKTKQGEVYCYELSFVNQGFMFSFERRSDWSDVFSEFSEIVENYKGIDGLVDRYIISDETIELAKELAQFDLFIKDTNKPQRELAASLFFKNKTLNKKILYNFSSIIEYADSIKKLEI
jgi:hypothetical protein